MMMMIKCSLGARGNAASRVLQLENLGGGGGVGVVLRC